MMTTHEINHEELMAWLDGELPPARALEVSAHVASCPMCQARRDELRAVSAKLGGWGVGSSPLTLESVRTAAEAPRGQADTPRTRLLRFPRGLVPGKRPWVWALAAAAVVIFGVFAVPLRLSRGASMRASDEGYAVTGHMPASMTSSIADGAVSSTATPTGFIAGRLDKTVVAEQQAGAVARDLTLIVRTASLRLSTDRFDEMRSSLERLARDMGGAIGSLTASGEASSRRSISATLRVPAAQLDRALEGLRALGHVLHETQSSDDITDSHRDLSVRIANARVEEQRLGEILARRTGDLSDVLAVEQAQSRVRGEIERMASEERAMRDRAALSTISVEINERSNAGRELGALPVPARLGNAMIDGSRAAGESLVAAAEGLLQTGQVVLLWVLLLGTPIWFVRRRMRPRRS